VISNKSISLVPSWCNLFW